jgi:putative ABC transport system permease protein
MRAIGAHRGFVRRMILSETAVLSVVFGVLGALIGMGILGILSAVGLEATNQFLRFIYGGEVLRPLISADAVGTALLGVLIAGLLASLYPTRVALKIRPVVAMQGK